MLLPRQEPNLCSTNRLSRTCLSQRISKIQNGESVKRNLLLLHNMVGQTFASPKREAKQFFTLKRRTYLTYGLSWSISVDNIPVNKNIFWCITLCSKHLSHCKNYFKYFATHILTISSHVYPDVRFKSSIYI